MALSLGWHIVLASFGIGFPLIMLIAEWRGIRTSDPVYLLLARRWASVLAVLFAIGAVSGTILSFELGILWPGFMGTFGELIGLPFVIEAVAFFIEAIFIGIYLYGWDRLSPRVHLLSGIPIVIAGVASAGFVVTANAFMNQPRGFDLVDGKVTNPQPWVAMFNPATPVQTIHMILAAFMVTGFGVAACYAWSLLRGKRDRYHMLGFLVPFVLGAAIAPVQILVGDWAARFLAEYQPVKFAAMEGLYQTQRGAPLSIGGIVADGEVKYALEIPKGLSFLGKRDPNAEIQGLDATPVEDRPPVAPVRYAFQVMVAIGTGLLLLGVWFAITWWRRRELPKSKLFLIAAVAAGPAAAIAMEAGWIVTEVGRQPWIVYEVMRVEDAVTSAPNIRYAYYSVIVLYTLLTAATIFVLRRLARRPFERMEVEAPQVADQAGS